MAMHNIRVRTLALVATLGLTLGGTSGCSNSTKVEETPTPRPSSSAPTPKAPDTPIETAHSTPTPIETPSESATPSPNLSDAFAGYGTDTIQVSAPTIPGAWNAGEYVAQNTRGDIQIIMLNDEVRIYSENWNTVNPYGTMPDTGYIANGIVLTAGQIPDGVTAYGSDDWTVGKPAKAGGDYRNAQVIMNGQALEYGNYICGSNDNGVTCWNTNTGHGAFVTAHGYTGF